MITQVDASDLQEMLDKWISIYASGTRTMPNDVPAFTYDEICSELERRGL